MVAPRHRTILHERDIYDHNDPKYAHQNDSLLPEPRSRRQHYSSVAEDKALAHRVDLFDASRAAFVNIRSDYSREGLEFVVHGCAGQSGCV